MPLNIDPVAESLYAQLIRSQRAARITVGVSQNALAERLPVRGRAISEWETGAIEPTLGHLFLWCRVLDHQLVLIRPDGAPEPMRLGRRPGEKWEVFQQRRLAFTLRRRRQTFPMYDRQQAVPGRRQRRRTGMRQGELAQLVGVTRDSIQRWELVVVPPRPIALIVWAQQLGYTLTLGPADGLPEPGTRTFPVPMGATPRALW